MRGSRRKSARHQGAVAVDAGGVRIDDGAPVSMPTPRKPLLCRLTHHKGPGGQSHGEDYLHCTACIATSSSSKHHDPALSWVARGGGRTWRGG